MVFWNCDGGDGVGDGDGDKWCVCACMYTYLEKDQKRFDRKESKRKKGRGGKSDLVNEMPEVN